MGTHWYEAPVEEYAPLYRLVRSSAAAEGDQVTVRLPEAGLWSILAIE